MNRAGDPEPPTQTISWVMASDHHPGNPLSPADTYVPPFDPPPGGFGTPMTASKEPPRVNITKEVLSAFKGMGSSKVPAYQHATGGKIPVQIASSSSVSY